MEDRNRVKLKTNGKVVIDDADTDLHRIATELAAENKRLRGALDLIARHRYHCHAYDDDVGHPLRDFDVEDVKIMEYVAKTALAAKS